MPTKKTKTTKTSKKIASVRPVGRPAKIKTPIGIVSQVRFAFHKRNRLATFLGMLLGGFIPFASFVVSHYELDHGAPHRDPLSILVLGALVYSASKVWSWGKKAFQSALLATGFTVLMEGVMVGSGKLWLSIMALIYLMAINAIATGVTLAMDQD